MRELAAVIFVLGLVLPACEKQPSQSVEPSEAAEAGEVASVDAWSVHEQLEASIDAGKVPEAARKDALEQVRSSADDGSAAYAYARASVAGRLAETRGLKALKLLEEVREWALKSIERDAAFQGMAATRMLGTLYVLGGQHIEEGDSEEGLELLESVVDALPDAPRNHLRLAEGYIALGDPEPALESLCVAIAGRDSLRPEEQLLLDRLLEDIGGAELLGCEGGEGA